MISRQLKLQNSYIFWFVEILYAKRIYSEVLVHIWGKYMSVTVDCYNAEPMSAILLTLEIEGINSAEPILYGQSPADLCT
jgi:hypothetical protein